MPVYCKKDGFIVDTRKFINLKMILYFEAIVN